MQPGRGKSVFKVLIAGAALLAILAIIGSVLREVAAGPVGDADGLGPVYPILEPDWSIWLPAQLDKRLGRRSLTASRNQVRAALRRQSPNIELLEVKAPRTYTVDPSVRVPHPATDPLGHNLTAGETFNPITYLAGFRPMVVIDGRKERHVQWAERALTKANSIVLTISGDVPALGARLGAPVYSAPPLLLERLSIARVPVVISQADGLVRVEEVIP